MRTLAKVTTVAFSAYALIAIIFPHLGESSATSNLGVGIGILLYAGLGLLIYMLFGRDWKVFGKQRQLQLQDLKRTPAHCCRL